MDVLINRQNSFRGAATLFFGLLVAILCPAGPAQGQIPGGAAADLVLGQTTFTDLGFSIPSTASSCDAPSGIAVDPTTGKVFVSDSGLHRVLRFASAADLMNGASAELVIGQASFAGSSSNQGGAIAGNTLSEPTGLFVDSNGNLWVADTGNSRVLLFLSASTIQSNNPGADRVFGQQNATSGTGEEARGRMNRPMGVWVDTGGSLWVADTLNSRVQRFDNAEFALSDGVAEDGIFGQGLFSANGSGLSATEMDQPTGVSVDSTGTLWVADTKNNRVLGFLNAATRGDGVSVNGPAADRFYGEPGLTTKTSTLGAQGLSGPTSVQVDAFGDLWVTDRGNNRVLRYDNVNRQFAGGAFANGQAANAVIGQSSFLDSDSSGLSATGLNNPSSGFLDTAGNLWVSDTGHSRALRFSLPDRSGPKLRIRGRKTIRTLRKRVVLRGTANDPSGITEVSAKVGRGARVQKVRTGSRWQVVLRLTGDRGRVVVKISALDGAGNRSRVQRARVVRR